jgi:hypothetical protein
MTALHFAIFKKAQKRLIFLWELVESFNQEPAKWAGMPVRQKKSLTRTEKQN